MALENRVYKYRCYSPRDPAEASLAEQLLGQAWNYREQLRRTYNEQKRDVRAALSAGDPCAHVLAFVHDRTNAQIRSARKKSQRGHLIDAGTYWLVEASVLQAHKASRLDPIKRQNWDGTGKLGALIQSVDKFPATDWKHPRVNLTTPDGRGHAELSIVVGEMSAGRRITWPCKVHRSLPPDGMVKQVAVQRTRSGHRFHWEVLITVCSEPVTRDLEARGVVGIDLGWRSEGELMRVATHDGGASAADKDVLRTDTLGSFLYADAVQGTRDDIFEDAKDYVRRIDLPGSEHAQLWRDKERMHRLARITGDFGVRWWRERDRHLEDIACGVRSRAVRRRLDLYRCYADRLAKRYRIVALEDMPMQTWVGEGETSPRERRRSVAALSLLQLIIAQRFGEDRVDWVPCAYTSMTCADCGAIRGEGVGPAPEWACEVCGADHHQDENAAAVIRKASERWIDDGNAPRARKRKAPRSRDKKDADGIGTGDDILMVVTPRETLSEAAE